MILAKFCKQRNAYMNLIKQMIQLNRCGLFLSCILTILTLFENTSCAHDYNSYLRGQIVMSSLLEKYQVAFSTNAPNGNFNQKNPQQQREHKRIKNRQKALSNI